MLIRKIVCLLSMLLLTGCDDRAWNDPYPNQSASTNTLYSAFSERPKHLDPAQSYTDNEWVFIGNIYEPPLEYDYFKRPYTLQPLTASQMPTVHYDAKTNTSKYIIKLKPGIYYQPHPAFAKDENDNFYYHDLDAKQAGKYRNIADFKHTGTRELKAEDYVYQIKRLADPKVGSPVFGFFSDYILGLSELRQRLSSSDLDLRQIDFIGAKVIDDYSYEINIKGRYPQFKYWLSMTFFAPMPWEAIKFYSQPGFAKRNISLDWYPVGTGAYYLVENNPERRMVLQRNPNFHQNFYNGERLPFIDQVFFSLEKESIPYWGKFMQGYYDKSGISSDNFNSAIRAISGNNIELSRGLIEKEIRLSVSNSPSVRYWGFNMLDDVVGGYSEKAKKLRQAISLAVNVEEYIDIFTNGRGIRACGPIPPEITGYKACDQQFYEQRLEIAKELFRESGYDSGLQLYYDVASSGDPNEKAYLAWFRKQLAKLNIDLIIRATDYNRFDARLRSGNSQIFLFGWHADYPDPENFFSLFDSKNAVTQSGGINSTNYANPEFDQLYDQFKIMNDSLERSQLINRMLQILENDSPWIWGYFPQNFILSHKWNQMLQPNAVAQNGLKYAKIDPELRAKMRLSWNKPILWPLALLILALVVLSVPAIIAYKTRENSKARRNI